MRKPKLRQPKVAQSLKNGDMVICPTGRVGLVIDIDPVASKSTVTFGATGPTRRYNWKTLRHASAQDITDADLDGVGCNPPPY